MKSCLAVLGALLFSTVAVAQTPPVTPPTSDPAQVVTVASVSIPEPILQATPVCGPIQNTGYHYVGGSTCAQARHDAEGHLIALTNCPCGFCSQSFFFGPCEVIQGGYRVPGNLRYSCKICVE